MKETIKDFKDVQIGDVAYTHPDAGGLENVEIEGEVVWKGNIDELKESKYKNLLEVWDWEWEAEMFEFDLVVLYTTGWDASNVIFQYNSDPSSCVVFN